MKRILALLLLWPLCWTACTSPEAQTDESVVVESPTDRSAERQNLPPAVPEDGKIERDLGQSELKETSLQSVGLDFSLKLPPGARVEPSPGNPNTVLISADDGSFQIIVETANIAMEDLVPAWKEKTPVGTFSQFIVNSRGGVLVEVEREGKLDYQVDYLFESYRLHTPFDQNFSRMQATKVFNVCRQIQGLNR